MVDERDSGVTATVRGLQVGQHALFALLTVICSVRAAQAGAPWAGQLLGAGLLVSWYAYGVVLARARSQRAAWAWFTVLVLLWAGLVLLSSENVWVAFSLWLLAGHLLPLWAAGGLSALVLAVVVLAPVREQGGTSYAAVIGPAVGSLIALGVARAQGRLVRDARERQELIAALERTRLSRDLHDTLAQDLLSIVLLARTGDPGALSQIEQLAASGLDETRRLVAELAPTDVDDLPAALRRLLARLDDETGIEGELRVDGPVDALPTQVEVALLRTCQGALANVRQHSGASRVVVSLTSMPGSVRVDLVDDGRGFAAPPDDRVSGSPLRGGYGLRASRERLHELGGELVVESAPGEGTAISASVPLPTSAPEDLR